MSVDAELKTFCAVHPDRETSLRCNKCDRLMCVQCAVRTPVGYRCRECARKQEDKYFNASNSDYLIVAGVCGAAGLGLGLLLGVLNLGTFALFGIILGLPAGGAIAELSLRLTARRRGRYSGEIGGVATLLGGLIAAVGYAYFNYISEFNRYAALVGERAAARDYPFPPIESLFFDNIGLLIFVGLAAFAVYGRYRMKL